MASTSSKRKLNLEDNEVIDCKKKKNNQKFKTTVTEKYSCLTRSLQENASCIAISVAAIFHVPIED
ncbi:hypothetical protein DPMN_156611 [Dreissena polymorpha]|uniref:Uncharacterized protein n=1 Tax=Dreissena polymorpha TaxID=45954 RepID=A0A9D4FPA8_DREPO|nr:hypothetical protein DPMN_156611 [Dreissena polymorpha]